MDDSSTTVSATGGLRQDAQPTEQMVETRFGTIAALVWGDGDGPPLLMLHGWLDNVMSFARLAPLLTGNRRIIGIDLPGHGHSAHLPPQVRRYHLVDQVDNVLDAADALGLDQFDLLGHSLGAGIGSLLAAADPARVRRLVLVDGLGPLADTPESMLERWRDAHGRRQRPQRKPRVFAGVQDAIDARVAVGDLSADEVRPIVERNLKQVTGGLAWRSDARLRQRTSLRLEEVQVRSLLTGIQAPTLLCLAAPVTPYLPTELIAARAACVDDITVCHVDGPHHLHIRHAHTLARRVNDFLASDGTSSDA